MRFRRLTIPAYGPFTGLELDFSKSKADFHLIHGRNEAGKSSLLRAIRDLLYGIHAQTADNFIHDYKDLRIGAEIENRAGQRLAIQRRKGNRNTLLDAAGNALADDALAPYLGPVDREFFTTMFGLGSEELRQGAHDLLQGRGDLGQALFSASLAGTPIHRVLEGLDGEARALFNGRTKIGVSLRPAVEAYDVAMRDSKLSQVRPETWEGVLRDLEAALNAKNELDADLHSRRSRQDWLRRCLDALPTLGRLREVEARLNEQPAQPALPAGYAERAAAARDALARSEQNLSALRQRIGDLLVRRDSLAPRADVLARAGEIDTLAASLAVYLQNHEALLADQGEAARMEARLETGLLELGLPCEPADIAGLRIPLAEQLALREAAADLTEAERAGAEQRRESEHLAAELEKTRARLTTLPQAENAALREAQAASAPAATLAPAAKAVALESLARRLASQHPLLRSAPADLEATYALALPAAARLREFEAAAADQATRARQLDEATRKTATHLRELKSRLDRLEQRGALPSRDDLTQARARREDGWRRVLACWREGAPESGWDGAPLAESYPAAVRQADTLADRLRDEADAVAQAEELRWRIQEAEATHQEQQAEAALLEQSRQTWQNDWNSLWRPTGLAAATPAEMLEWREQWNEFRNRFDAWRELNDELQDARQHIAEAEVLLRPLLGGADKPLPELRELAEQRLRAADQVLGERRVLEASLSELHSVAEVLARQRPPLDSALLQAQIRWRGSRLGGEHRPETALRLLQARLDLVAQYDVWTRLRAALAEKQNARMAYERQARALAEELSGGLPFLQKEQSGVHASIAAEAWVNTLREALSQARALRERRVQVEEDLEQLLASRPRAERDAEVARRNMAALLAQAGAADQPTLQNLLADLAARQQLLAERDSLRAALHVPARGETLDHFIERVRGEEGQTLAAELEDLADHIREQETRREQAIQALARAEDAQARLESSGANAAEHLQTARHAAARIRQDAARYLRLRLATQFLQAQIEAFRERNQGPLLAKAGELFRRMTGTSFTGLGAAYSQDDTPTLVGLKDGVAVPVEGMSEGTRDQLYLALRLAAIEQRQGNHEPMPLILDDLLITFDDDRARAILPLLRNLAGTTQILLFTHHRHLLYLARETLPGEAVCLHELDGAIEPGNGG